MSDRIQKQLKRLRRRTAEQTKEDRRQRRVVAQFLAHGGPDGPMMRALRAFFTQFLETRDAVGFETMLAHVRDLNLLKLDAHKYGIAAAIVAVLEQHPSERDAWRAAEQEVVDTSLRLAAPNDPLDDVSHPGQVDVLWARYLYGGNVDAAKRALALCERPGRVGIAAAAAAGFHAGATRGVREIMIELGMIQPERTEQARVDADLPVAPGGPTPRQLWELSQAVSLLADGRRALHVSWIPGKPGHIAITTPDGTSIVDAPGAWQGFSVCPRRATPSEMGAWRRGIDAASDPI